MSNDAQPTWSYRATFDATPVSASRARAFVTRHLVEHRLLHLVDPVRLVASELATRSLIHAQTSFTVTLSATDETVLLTVLDDSRALPEERGGRAHGATGRGLEIVDIVSLAWGIDEDETGSRAVWASFAIRRGRTS